MPGVPEPPIEETPVLIVGGSLVGLTLAALLGKYGVQGCITVEKHSTTAIHPRAAVMMPRTMQVFKELGLYETMQEESLKYYDKHTCIITIESLAGKFLKSWQADVNEGIEDISATRRVFLTQQTLEPLLRRKATEYGADLRFSTEMVDFTQDDTGVTAVLRNRETGAERKVKARYMIAADGFRSGVRSQLGIKSEGPGLLSRALTIYFQVKDTEALDKLPNAKYSGVIYVANEVVRAFFRFDKPRKESFLVINSAGEQGTEESRFPADTMTDEKAAEYLRAAIGADIACEIHELSTWEAVADVPERIREGRVFLAGDAAHRMPPSGGFGGNTGVQDVHNLAWKLAFVLQSKAGEELLDTYEAERWPVAKQTVDQAFSHYVHRTAPELKHDPRFQSWVDNVRGIPVVELELAYKYHSKALYSEKFENITEDPATAIAKPGSVAHHVLADTPVSRNVPIAEFFGRSFVLFVESQNAEWASAVKAATHGVKGMPVVEVQQLLFDGKSAFAARYAISESGAVLVRPDGFVAWSSRSGPATGRKAEDVFAEVLKRVLCLS